MTSNLLRELKRTDGYTKHSWIAFSGMMMPLIDIQKRLLYVCLCCSVVWLQKMLYCIFPVEQALWELE